jgi:hypothetical protein
VSLPLGHRIDGEFVCMRCITSADHRLGGIDGRGSAVDERVGSGTECSRCERRMPYLATVRLLPDGFSSFHAPDERRGVERAIRMEREEKTLVAGHALVYVEIGCDREVGLSVSPSGKVEVWVHDDPYGDRDGPSACWTYDPSTAAPSDGDAAPSASPSAPEQTSPE